MTREDGRLLLRIATPADVWLKLGSELVAHLRAPDQQEWSVYCLGEAVTPNRVLGYFYRRRGVSPQPCRYVDLDRQDLDALGAALTPSPGAFPWPRAICDAHRAVRGLDRCAERFVDRLIEKGTSAVEVDRGDVLEAQADLLAVFGAEGGAERATFEEEFRRRCRKLGLDPDALIASAKAAERSR